LGLLDGDAGIRVVGKYGGAECFAFATRFRSAYTVVVYSAKEGRKRVPQRRLASKEFGNLPDLVAFLKSIAGTKIDAYAY
ncbi:MAG TPA: hypothetical protein VKF15_05965, partial [Nitrososphaerales archaeon]|nr:hypothetical protein [Nitrososphaerales archaeon]